MAGFYFLSATIWFAAATVITGVLSIATRFQEQLIAQQSLQPDNDSKGGEHSTGSAKDGHKPPNDQIPAADLQAAQEQQKPKSDHDEHATSDKDEGVHFETPLGTLITNWLMAATIFNASRATA